MELSSTQMRSDFVQILIFRFIINNFVNSFKIFFSVQHRHNICLIRFDYHYVLQNKNKKVMLILFFPNEL